MIEVPKNPLGLGGKPRSGCYLTACIPGDTGIHIIGPYFGQEYIDLPTPHLKGELSSNSCYFLPDTDPLPSLHILFSDAAM